MEIESLMTISNLDTALKALDEGRFEEATSILERLIEIKGEDPDILVYLGIAYVQSENPQRAVDVLQRADEMIEEHCIVSLFLGRALKALGRVDEAEAELRQAIRLEADVSEAWLDLAHIYYSKGEYGTAIEILNEAFEQYPNDPTLHGLCGTCFHRLGDYSAETEQWKIIHKIQPESYFAIWNCAYSLLIQEKTSEAKEYVELAGSMKPDDYHYLILESELAIQNVDYEQAMKFLDKAMDQDPNCVPALARLAVIAHKNHSISKCHSYVEKVEFEMEDKPQKWWALQYIFSRVGWDSHLINCLIRGTKEDSGAAAPWIELAKVYGRKDMWDEAYPAWIRSFELRKYVKIECGECNNIMRIPYLPHIGFDFNEQRFCLQCNSTIEIPQGLAGK
jgi:tetratricopeptide (TPR) repeat protein